MKINILSLTRMSFSLRDAGCHYVMLTQAKACATKSLLIIALINNASPDLAKDNQVSSCNI
jgi:hypothetical protein